MFSHEGIYNTVKSKEKELKKLLALKLYEKGILGMGKARELLGASRLEFMYILKEEGIPLNYDQEELEHDIKAIEGNDFLPVPFFSFLFLAAESLKETCLYS